MIVKLPVLPFSMGRHSFKKWIWIFMQFSLSSIFDMHRLERILTMISMQMRIHMSLHTLFVFIIEGSSYTACTYTYTYVEENEYIKQNHRIYEHEHGVQSISSQYIQVFINLISFRFFSICWSNLHQVQLLFVHR